MLLCCSLFLDGQPRTVEVEGAALQVAERRKLTAYPELACRGPQRLLVPGTETGGRWSTAAQNLVKDLVRLRAHRAPLAVRAAASSSWAHRSKGALSVAVQQDGRQWPVVAQTCATGGDDRSRACWSGQPGCPAALAQDGA